MTSLPLATQLADSPLPPLFLVDLDDTLFQTGRRLASRGLDPKATATDDQHGQPLGMMSARQWHWWRWLQQHARLVPVTARSSEGLARVQLELPFPAICAHGAVILQQPDQPDPVWWQRTLSLITPLQASLTTWYESLPELGLTFLAAHFPGQTLPMDALRVQLQRENGLIVYGVVRQSRHLPLFLTEFMQWLPPELLAGCYLHRNGVTLALIPEGIGKAEAVAYLLPQICQPDQPVIGLGDSLSDCAFLQQCDWWGMPAASQLDHWVGQQLASHLEQAGGYWHD